MRKLGLSKVACAVILLCAATALPAQTFTTLLNFNDTNGSNPYTMSLVQGADGNLYGTTREGGTQGGGNVFKVTPTGTLTTLYNFCSQADCKDGQTPLAGLVLGADGNFYGTTALGGSLGVGTVFKITPAGVLTTLHNFCVDQNEIGACIDGENPPAGLIQATNGNFYGVTGDGAIGKHTNGRGTIFEITPSGTLTTLFTFDGTDGAGPSGELVQATDGLLYGTTSGGGANGDGTVFSITTAGTLTTLHSFDGTDGAGPHARLIQAANGNFYGTTVFGGTSSACSSGCGTIFEITPGGALTTLHSFDSTDGANPYAPLVQATNGNFYGTTVFGGTCSQRSEAGGAYSSGCGTIFEITPGSTLTTLLSFDVTDGYYPYGGLFQATNGTLYGTTYDGNETPNGFGTVFSLAVGLGPFVETNPTSGSVGTAVTILGNNLTGSTSVTFNGVEAAFTAVSSTEITTTVPSGATTGNVQVKTPRGTLTSNVNFQVQ